MTELQSSRADGWVCLVYHDVQPALTSAGGGPERFSVSVSAFGCMLDTIAQSGARGCSLADAFAGSGRRVAITFDDGNLGQYEHAVPALLARGMTATFYVTTDWVGRPGFATWDHLREMVASGMSVQSHTRSHPFLSELGEERLRAELSSSKAKLDDMLGQDTREIAFPGGDAPSKPLRYVMAETGYRVAVGTRWGVNHGVSAEETLRAFVRRCTVRGEITPSDARRMVEADPWVGLRSRAKETALRRIRSTLGASRYARWRRLVLDAVRS